MNNYTFWPRPGIPSTGASEPAASALPFTASDLVFDNDLSIADVQAVLDAAGQVREHPKENAQALSGRTLALLFEKPSLRTRVTFEVAMKSMGGESVFIDCRDEMLGHREPVRDVARNLDR